MKNPDLFIVTFGCRLNQYQSDRIMDNLTAKGFHFSPNPEQADIIIVNGCVVTHKAERDTRKAISKFLHRGKKIIATGCYINYPVNKSPDVEWLSMQEILSKFNAHGLPQTRVANRKRALVGIQEGCDFRCSYCIVPKVRGKSRYREAEEILKEIDFLVCNGVKEIVLTGTQIGDWGKQDKAGLSHLIKAIKNRYSVRIRLSSILPNHVDKSLISLLKNGYIMPHFHIAIQSGSDKILRDMKRPYKTEQFVDIFNKLQSASEYVSIGTDVIVGFPTETEEDFERTLDIMNALPFSYLHVFEYSPRDGTEAALLKKLPASVINTRKQVLLEVAKEKRKQYIDRFIGRQINVLIERCADNTCYGTSDNYIKVQVQNKENLTEGQVSRILLFENKKSFALGRLLSENIAKKPAIF